MSEQFAQIAARIRELREISGYTVAQMAAELGITPEVYGQYEHSGENIPISVLYHLSQRLGVDLNILLTGAEARLDTYCLVRRGQGQPIDRYPGYRFHSLAHKYARRIMEPLMVTLDPEDHDPQPVTHPGQEFNYVLEGAMELLFDGKRFVLEAGDSVYFNPTYPHGQRAYGGQPARFLTVIAE